MNQTLRTVVLYATPCLLMMLGLFVAKNLPCREFYFSSIDDQRQTLELYGLSKARSADGLHRGVRINLASKKTCFAEVLRPSFCYLWSADQDVGVVDNGKKRAVIYKTENGEWGSTEYAATLNTSLKLPIGVAKDLVAYSKDRFLQPSTGRIIQIRLFQTWKLMSIKESSHGSGTDLLSVSPHTFTKEGYRQELCCLQVDQGLNVSQKWQMYLEGTVHIALEGNRIYRVCYELDRDGLFDGSSAMMLEARDLATGSLLSRAKLPESISSQIQNCQHEKDVQYGKSVLRIQSNGRLRTFLLSNFQEVMGGGSNQSVWDCNPNGSILVCTEKSSTRMIDGSTQEVLLSADNFRGCLYNEYFTTTSNWMGGTFGVAERDSGRVLYHASPFAWLLLVVPMFFLGSVLWSLWAFEQLGMRVSAWLALILLAPLGTYLHDWPGVIAEIKFELLSILIVVTIASCLWLVSGWAKLRWRLLPVSLVVLMTFAAIPVLSQDKALPSLACVTTLALFLPVCIWLRTIGCFPSPLQFSCKRPRIEIRDYFAISALVALFLNLFPSIAVFESGFKRLHLGSTGQYLAVAAPLAVSLAVYCNVKQLTKIVKATVIVTAVVLMIDFELTWALDKQVFSVAVRTSLCFALLCLLLVPWMMTTIKQSCIDGSSKTLNEMGSDFKASFG